MDAPKPKQTLLNLSKEIPLQPKDPPKPPEPTSSTGPPQQSQSSKPENKVGGETQSSKESPFDKIVNKDKKEDKTDAPKDQLKSNEAPSKSKSDSKKDGGKPKKKGLFSKMFGKDKDPKKDQDKGSSQEVKPDNKADQKKPDQKETDGSVQKDQELAKDGGANRESVPSQPGPSQEMVNGKDAGEKKEETPKKDDKEMAKNDGKRDVINDDSNKIIQPAADAVTTPAANISDKDKSKKDDNAKPEAPEVKNVEDESKFPMPKVEEGSKYPLPKSEEGEKKPLTEEKMPEEIKPLTEEKMPEEKKPEEKKSGGFFGKLFGKEEKEETQKDKKDVKKDDKKEGEGAKKDGEAEKKPKEKSGGFFSGLFGKDGDKDKEEKSKNEDKKPEKDGGGFFDGVNKLFKKDEPPKEESEGGEKKEDKSGEFFPEIKFFGKDEEVVKDKDAIAGREDESQKEKGDGEMTGESKVPETKDAEDVDNEIKIEDEAAEEGMKITEPIKKGIKVARPDIEDNFESGDACLVKGLGKPCMKNLTLNPKIDSRFGGVLTNCERILGIIPGRFVEHQGKKSDPESTRGIYVWGLIPRGPADKAGVEIGDWIIAINDTEVHSNNFQKVVKEVEIERKVKLKLQKVLLQVNAFPIRQKSLKPPDSVNIRYPALVNDLSGHGVSTGETLFEIYPHGVLYLNNHILPNELQEFDAREDVIYNFPNVRENNIMDYRGSFLTLHSLIPFISGSSVDTTTLEHNNREIRISYQAYKNGLLLICLPAMNCSQDQLKHYSEDIRKVIQLQFSTVESAFGNPSNHRKLDELLALVFLTIISPGQTSLTNRFSQSTFPEGFFDSSTCTRSICISPSVKMQVDDHLSHFEAESFGNSSEDYYGSRRIFDILGSAFFYKGYLISSHLPMVHSQDIYLLLKYNNLLSRKNTQQLGHSYLWMEVFFNQSEPQTHKQSPQCSLNIGQFTIYKRLESSNQRSFLLALSAVA